MQDDTTMAVTAPAMPTDGLGAVVRHVVREVDGTTQE